MATKTETVSYSLRATPELPNSTKAAVTDANNCDRVSSLSMSAAQEAACAWQCAAPAAPSTTVAASSESADREAIFSSDGASEFSDIGRSVEESCRRSLDHFPNPELMFPTPALDFDFRVAVKLRPESSRIQSRAAPASTPPKEVIAISAGKWSGSFGNGRVMAGGYDLGQARGFRPIRIVEGAFVLQTTDEPPAVLELRTRGSLSGPSDVLDTLLSPRQPKDIDPRKYGFRMFSTIKSADKRYAEIVNCALWIASGVWKDDELIIDAYRVT